MFVPADKSWNIFLLNKIEYEKLLTQNVTGTYTKSSFPKTNEIDKSAKCVAVEFNIEDWTEWINTKEAL